MTKGGKVTLTREMAQTIRSEMNIGQKLISEPILRVTKSIVAKRVASGQQAAKEEVMNLDKWEAQKIRIDGD